jgi:hypothetical protein
MCMYADDVVLMSTTDKGIQSCFDKFISKFAKDWKMTINTNKTKMLVFNKGGRLKNINIKYNNSSIECVQKYTYIYVSRCCF